MPNDPDLPTCFLPLHLWMDKGKVSSTVNMHPILLRAGFLPNQIRNGSGNGGGVLIGYMPKVGSPKYLFPILP
jgi:Plavaka transposase